MKQRLQQAEINGARLLGELEKESILTNEKEIPERIWMRAEVLASAELRERFTKLNNNDIEYTRVRADGAAPVVDQVVNFKAWTTIDRWLRENPQATAAECLAELVQRIKVEAVAAPLAATEGEAPTEVLCACRTFNLDPTLRAYLDCCDFVHTTVACPEMKLEPSQSKEEGG